MSLMEKKYRKLLKELLFVNSEWEYVKDAMKDAHADFELYYQKYCRDNNVPISELNSKNKDKLKKIFPEKKPKVDGDGLVKIDKPDVKYEKVDKTLQKMYRAIASKIHPDKFSNVEKTPDVIKKMEKFKEVTSSYDEKNWAKFLDICDKYDILPNRYSKIMDLIESEITEVSKKVAQSKKAFSWRLHECDENDSCKQAVIKDFLFQLFRYKA